MNGFAALLVFSVFQTVFQISIAANAVTGGYYGAGDNLISVMAYNTENTFDVKHDEGKDDYTFLPLGFPGKEKHCYAAPNPVYRDMCLKTDWTEDKAELKIHQLKRMIASPGYLPDVVALEEIENETVVGNLAKDLGYEKFLITDSPDARGIDVALMFNQQKLVYMSHQEIVVTEEKPKLKTRNILRVNFRVKGREKIVLGVYVNHWPSQQKPKETRMLAAETLLEDIKAQQKKFAKKNFYAVAVGDLNTTERETPNAITDVLSDTMEDAQVYAQKLTINKGQDSGLEGTYFYPARWKWERLDRILVSKNLLGKGELALIPESFTIVKPSFGLQDYTEQKPKSPHYGKTMRNVPIRYDFGSTNPDSAGFSDHFPVLVNIQM